MKKRSIVFLALVLALVFVLGVIAPAAAAATNSVQLKVTNKTYLMNKQTTSSKNRIMEVPAGSFVTQLKTGSSYYQVSYGGKSGYIQKKHLTSSWGLGEIGSVKIADTKVNYPIMLANDNTYYMTRNEKGNKSAAGAVFADFRNADETRRRNFILYGHNMKDGSMFAALHKYEDASFFANHSTVDVNLSGNLLFDKGNLKFKVFAAAVMHTENDMNYWRTQFESGADFTKFVQQIYDTCAAKVEKGDAQVLSNFNAGNVKQVVTLSTCTKPSDLTGRYVVFAYR